MYEKVGHCVLFFAAFTAGVVSTELFRFSTTAYAQKVLTYKVVYEEALIMIAEAKVEGTLSAYTKQGWKLHSIAGNYMIFER